MSRDTESMMHSAVSVSGAESFSDEEYTLGVGDKTGVITGNFASNLLDLGDGDLHIVINGATLETHKFLIKRFAGLKARINDGIIALDPGEPEGEVFKNAFKILYASVVEGPFEFDHITLTSALLLATKYDYPALRTFAVTKLENAALSAVERIRLARDFDIPSWEEPAYLELCERDEAVTMPEATILGLETVVHVAKIREKELRRRGTGTDAAGERKIGGVEHQANSPEVVETPTPAKAQSTSSTAASSDSDDLKGTRARMVDEESEATPNPCFIGFPESSPRELRKYHWYFPTKGNRIQLDVPGCECWVSYSDNPKVVCQCKLPPCAISAFKHLQAQQLTHKNKLSAFETTIDQVQVAIATLKLNVECATDTVSPAHIRSGFLRDDIQEWLAIEKKGGSCRFIGGRSPHM